MPIYEYECKACGGVQELMQKVDEPPPPHCGKCAQGPLVKLISRTGFILKGGGWYVTDFRGGGKPAKDAAKDAAKSTDTGDAGDAAKGDAKPAKKQDTSSEGGSGGDGGTGGRQAQSATASHSCATGCASKHAI